MAISREMAAEAPEIRLLVADSDYSVRNIIRIALIEAGWVGDEAPDGITALKLFRRRPYHLAVIDFDLAELDGPLVCRQMRKASPLPVIFISGHTEESSRLAAFAAGGNDYVLKPFYPRELIARIRSFLSLTGPELQVKTNLVSRDLVIDLMARDVLADGRPVDLTPREYDLLLFFCRNPGRVYSRENLLNSVWGENFQGSDRTVDSHIKSLRAKIRPLQSRLVTIWGVGYKYEQENQ